MGKYAYATPTKIAESEDDIKDFTENEKDILLSKDRTLEVKSRSFHFTSVDDYLSHCFHLSDYEYQYTHL